MYSFSKHFPPFFLCFPSLIKKYVLIGGSTIFRSKINLKEIDRKAVNVPDSLLVCCLKAATAQEVLCYGLTRPLSLCSSPSILFRLAMLRSGNKQSFRYFRRVVFEKVPMFKYFNFFGKLACENIFIFAHNSKQGSKEGTTLSNALELRPIMIFDMRM